MATRVISVMPSSLAVSSSPHMACADDEYRFDRLVQGLKQALGSSSGLTSDDVDVGHLTRLMEKYNAKEKGWMPYNFGDASRGYTRNLVDEGNGKSNLVGSIECPLLHLENHSVRQCSLHG